MNLFILYTSEVVSINFKFSQDVNHDDAIKNCKQLLHCVKCVRIRSYSGRPFPAFGLNTERYGVSLHIQSKCGKMLTRVTPNTDTFYAVLPQWILDSRASLTNFETYVTIIDWLSIKDIAITKMDVTKSKQIKQIKDRSDY